MIERVSDPAVVNAVFNNPLVRDDIADIGGNAVDLTAVVQNGQNFCLFGENGGFVFLKYDVGIYEVHSAVLPSGRGKWALSAAKDAIAYMFTATDAVEVLTRVPQGHIGAMALAKAVGFRHQFVTPPECVFRGQRVPCSILTLLLQEWSVRADGFEGRGAELHEVMRKMFTGIPHDPDPDHNRIVGIALDMVEHGQVAKGLAWYNRWAVAARHQLVSVVNAAPLQIAFDAGILTFAGGGIRIEARH